MVERLGVEPPDEWPVWRWCEVCGVLAPLGPDLAACRRCDPLTHEVAARCAEDRQWSR